ncbi:MAG: hypothetical protein FJY17_03620, partial [Bacteroidetes bacterium]|nr:hypothetical protein [Bacteroidota bacterium]
PACFFPQPFGSIASYVLLRLHYRIVEFPANYLPYKKTILAPADIKKSGTAFDLPIAIGILVASEHLHSAALLNEFILKSSTFVYFRYS